MFEEIAPRYDRLNTILSLGLDRRWRRWAARSLGGAPAGPCCDLASGTGALAAALAESGRPCVRADLSAALLRLGAVAANGRPTGGGPPDGGSPAVACEMDRLPFRDGAFTAVGQGFALRHCHEFGAFFRELHRITRPGGRIALLDMRYPADGAFGPLYRLYFRAVLPRLAALCGGERSAYEMMVTSVRGLPEEDLLRRVLEAAGFVEVASDRGFLGAVRLLRARRP